MFFYVISDLSLHHITLLYNFYGLYEGVSVIIVACTGSSNFVYSIFFLVPWYNLLEIIILFYKIIPHNSYLIGIY